MLRILFGGLLLLLVISCKKVKLPPGVASLTIINGVTGTSSLSTNFKGSDSIWYAKSNQVVYGSFDINSNRYNTAPGLQPLGLFNYPDTLAKDKPLFRFDLDLPAGSNNSLFLFGTIDEPESLLTRDELPFYEIGDSTMGIRFINLIKGSGEVSVNLTGKPYGSELASLTYKSITAFNRYEVKRHLSDYVFEFREKATGILLAAYQTLNINSDGVDYPNTWVFGNFTLVLLGKSGGTGDDAPRVVLMAHSNV